MSVSSFLAAAAVPTLGGMGAAGGIGAFRWLHKLTGVAGQLAQVTKDLSSVTEQLGAQAAQIRGVRRDLSLHIRQSCTPRHHPAGDRVPAPAGPAED